MTGRHSWAVLCAALALANCSGSNVPGTTLPPTSSAASRAPALTGTSHGYQAIAAFPALANTTQNTGIVEWALFAGRLNGNPYEVIVGTTANAGIVWEADASTSASGAWTMLTTNSGTNILAESNGNVIVTKNALSTDLVYAGAMLRDMESEGGAYCPSTCPGRTGPIQMAKAQDSTTLTASQLEAIAKGFHRIGAGTVSAALSSRVTAAELGIVAAGISDIDPNVPGAWILQFLASPGDLILDPSGAPIPNSSFSQSVGDYVQADPYVTDDPAYVHIPVLNPPQYSNPIDQGPAGTGKSPIGDGSCQINATSESLICIVLL